MKIKKVVLIIFCLSLVQNYRATAQDVRTNAEYPNLKVSPTNTYIREEVRPKYDVRKFASLFVNTILEENKIEKISITRHDECAKYF
ncbi:MAG: hypothetical protein ABIH57_03020 [Candidatus Omnitrophota bacterium]